MQALAVAPPDKRDGEGNLVVADPHRDGNPAENGRPIDLFAENEDHRMPVPVARAIGGELELGRQRGRHRVAPPVANGDAPVEPRLSRE